jgi:hypothetical protein
MKKILAIACLIAAGSSIAHADIVQIDVMGSVDFGGVPSGAWADIVPGDAVTMSFQIDSNNFVDSGMFPTRGYEIIQSSFDLTLGGISAGLAPEQRFGALPYFIIRNDDPAVDGFFLGTNVDGFPNGVATDMPSLIAPTFDALFEATYEGTRLDSLDILDAVGTYDFGGLSVFNWGLEDEFIQPMGFIFDSWSISVVPAPSGLAMLSLAGLVGTRRRR